MEFGKNIELVVIGCSMGGMDALKVLLPQLNNGFNTPVVIVVHRETSVNEMLVEFLQKLTAYIVREPDDKEFIRRGTIYLAPPAYHLLVDGDAFSLTTDPPVNFARPSIDELFWSAAENYRSKVLGILLTGAGNDGARGLQQISLQGGRTIVQDPATAHTPAMPKAALELVKPDFVLPLNRIAEKIIELCR
jgi:two-component system chemotaxis response regulator CheB